ncbi:hypothetical protein QCD79_32930, partial [Pseudomonas quasicaspiana]|nr:hypothetical protein [Pseudomonas quasicaspiana]
RAESVSEGLSVTAESTIPVGVSLLAIGCEAVVKNGEFAIFYDCFAADREQAHSYRDGGFSCY